MTAHILALGFLAWLIVAFALGTLVGQAIRRADEIEQPAELSDDTVEIERVWLA